VKAPPRARVESPVEVVSAPATEPETVELPAIQATEDDAPRRNIERARERERLLAECDVRIQQLIESIDWTRADSRVRFPVEHDLIKADLQREQALLGSDGEFEKTDD